MKAKSHCFALCLSGHPHSRLNFPMESTRKRKLTPELKPQTDVKREKISLKFSKLWRKSRFSGRKDIPNHLTSLLSFCAKSEATVRLFLLILLASVSDLAISFLPGLPILQLGNQPAVPRLVDVLLSALQGPPIWGGNNWFVSRPWVLTAKIARSTAPLPWMPAPTWAAKPRSTGKNSGFGSPTSALLLLSHPTCPTQCGRR